MFGNKEKKIESIIDCGREKRTNKVISAAMNKDPDIRAAAAKACKHLRNGEAYQLLTNLVRDPEKSVRLAAIETMGKFGRQEAISHLNHIKDTENDPDIQAACVEAINELHLGARE